MSNQGGFSEEAFEKYQRLLSEQGNVEFSEGETYDFTRCMRPDGSFYGTRGKCKKGSEAGAKEKEAGKPKAGSMLTVSDSKRREMVAAAKARQQKRDAEAKPTRATSSKIRDLQDRIAKGDKAAMEEMRKLRAEGKVGKESAKAWGPGAKQKADEDIEGLRKLMKNSPAAKKAEADRSETKPKRKLASTAETRPAWQEAEKAVKAAKAEYARVKAETKGDKSPEANKRRIAAGTALDKAERKALKASEKFGAAQKREDRKAMTPEQRKEEREWDKFKKQYG
jgi:hypothetical protein